jgi:hypothetical protein
MPIVAPTHADASAGQGVQIAFAECQPRTSATAVSQRIAAASSGKYTTQAPASCILETWSICPAS